MAESSWSGVRERVLSLAGAPNATEVFGAESHRFALEPVLTPAELAELEKQLGVELPGEYRSFLLEVGRGGGGPYYGVLALRRDGGTWAWEDDGGVIADLSTLGQPFPHVEPFYPTAETGEPPSADGFPSEEEFDAARDAWWRDADEVIWAPPLSWGAVYLCDRGCALRQMLIVSGPARGEMWADDRADGDGLHPLTDAGGNRVGFARWYLGWLDQATEQAGTRPVRRGLFRRRR